MVYQLKEQTHYPNVKYSQLQFDQEVFVRICNIWRATRFLWFLGSSILFLPKAERGLTNYAVLWVSIRGGWNGQIESAELLGHLQLSAACKMSNFLH